MCVSQKIIKIKETMNLKLDKKGVYGRVQQEERKRETMELYYKRKIKGKSKK